MKVFRVLIALVLFRFLAESAGIDLMVASCETPCEESGAGDCSPACERCVCCSHQRVVTLQEGAETPVPDVRCLDFAIAVSSAPDSGVQEIFHIPKHVFSV